MLWEFQELPCKAPQRLDEEPSAMQRVLNLEESISATQRSILQRLSALEAREAAAPHQPQISEELAEATKRLSALEADIVALNLQRLDHHAAEVEAGACGYVRRTCQTAMKPQSSSPADAKTEVFQDLQGVFSEASSSLDSILQRCSNRKTTDGCSGSIDTQPPSSSDSSGQRSTAATERDAHHVNGYDMTTANQSQGAAKDGREDLKQALVMEMQEAVRVVVHNSLQGLRRSEEKLIVERTKELLATARTSLGQLQADFAARFEEVGATLQNQVEAFFEQRLENGQMNKIVVPGKVLPPQRDVSPVLAQAVPIVHDLATPPSSPRSSACSSASLSSMGEPLFHVNQVEPVNQVDERTRRPKAPACVPKLRLPPPLYEPFADGRCFKEREPPLPPLFFSAHTKDPSLNQVVNCRQPSAARSSLASGNLSGSAGTRRPTPNCSWQRALRRVLI